MSNSNATNEKYATFLAQKLEYLPPKQSTQSVVMNKELIEAKKGGYILPPPLDVTQQKQTKDLAFGQNQPQNFYDEVEANKIRSWDKVYKVLKYNPFVPLGCLVTVGVLINGVRAMRLKDRNKSQQMMRYRVAAQGSTLIALVLGTMVANYWASVPPS